MVPCAALHRLSAAHSSSNLIVERGSLSTSDAFNGFTSEPSHAAMDRSSMAPASQPGNSGAGDMRIKRLKALETSRPLSSSKSLQYLRVMERGGLSMQEFAHQMKADARTQVSPPFLSDKKPENAKCIPSSAHTKIETRALTSRCAYILQDDITATICDLLRVTVERNDSLKHRLDLQVGGRCPFLANTMFSFSSPRNRCK
jgi:hypothetical protein